MGPKKIIPQPSKTEIAAVVETILAPFRSSSHGARPLKNKLRLSHYSGRQMASRAIFVI